MFNQFSVPFIAIVFLSAINAKEDEATRIKRQLCGSSCGISSSQQGYMGYPYPSMQYQSPQYQPVYGSSASYPSFYPYTQPTNYLNPTGQLYQYAPSSSYQYGSSQQYQPPPQYQPVQYQPTAQYQPMQYQPVQYQPAQQAYTQSVGCGGPSVGGGSTCSCPSGFTVCFRFYGPNRCCSKK